MFVFLLYITILDSSKHSSDTNPSFLLISDPLSAVTF